MKTISGCRTAAMPVSAQLRSGSYRTLAWIPELGRRIGLRSGASADTRDRSGGQGLTKAPGTILAKLTDGPLSGSTRDVTAVEGRPPKTIDIDVGPRTVRYCLADWEQSGQSATYGFLYDV